MSLPQGPRSIATCSMFERGVGLYCKPRRRVLTDPSVAADTAHGICFLCAVDASSPWEKCNSGKKMVMSDTHNSENTVCGTLIWKFR